MNRKRISGREKGSVLVLFALALTTIFGGAGLSFDIARMYMAKEEGQAYADAAALASVVHLNGQLTGIAAAKTAALQVGGTVGNVGWKNHSFSNLDYNRAAGNAGDIELQFCRLNTCPTDPDVSPSPTDATGYRFTYVKTKSNVPLYLLPLVTGRYQTEVVASAVAGQINANNWSEGLFPFAPFERQVEEPGGGLVTDPTGNLGMTKNQWYTFAWSRGGSGLAADEVLMAAFNFFGKSTAAANGYAFTATEFLSSTNGTPAYTALQEIGAYLRGETVKGQNLQVNGGKDPRYCPGDTTPAFLKSLIARTQIMSGFGSTFDPDPNATYPRIGSSDILYDKGFYNDEPNVGTKLVKEAVTQGYQDGDNYSVGSTVFFPPGAREALQSPIIEMIHMDANLKPNTNGNTAPYSMPSPAVAGDVQNYFSGSPTGTGERLIVAPIATLSGAVGGQGQTATISGFRGFLLLADDKCKKNCKQQDAYYGGNTPKDNWCAAYVGDILDPIGTTTPAVNGVYVVRLIQ